MVVDLDYIQATCARSCFSNAATGLTPFGAGLLPAGGYGAQRPAWPTDTGNGLGCLVIYIYRLANRLDYFLVALRCTTYS